MVISKVKGPLKNSWLIYLLTHKIIYIGLTPEECSDKKSLSTFFAELVTHCDDSKKNFCHTPTKANFTSTHSGTCLLFFEIDGLFQVL